MKIRKSHKLIIDLSQEEIEYRHIYEEDGNYTSYDRKDKPIIILQHAIKDLVVKTIKSFHSTVDDNSIKIKVIDTEPLTVKVKFDTVTTTYTHKLEVPSWHKLVR